MVPGLIETGHTPLAGSDLLGGRPRRGTGAGTGRQGPLGEAAGLVWSDLTWPDLPCSESVPLGEGALALRQFGAALWGPGDGTWAWHNMPVLTQAASARRGTLESLRVRIQATTRARVLHIPSLVTGGIRRVTQTRSRTRGRVCSSKKGGKHFYRLIATHKRHTIQARI